MTEEEVKLVTDLVVALQLLVSSFSLTHKPSRISVSTVKGWVTGIVTDGTEMAIDGAIAVLRRAAQHLKQVDPEWKHALDELIPPKRLKQSKKKKVLFWRK